MGLMRYTVGSVAVLVLVAGEVFAVDPIQLNPLVSSFYTGGDSSVMTWDRTNATYAVNSPFFTLSSTNTASSPALSMVGWNAVVQFVPQSGATGTLQIKSSTISVPDPAAINTPRYQAVNRNLYSSAYETAYGYGYYDYAYGYNDIAPPDPLDPSTGTGNLLRFGLTTSDNANGTFLVRVVGDPVNTNWTYLVGEDPFTSNFSNAGSGVLNLGTVIVTAPEPSLVAMGVGGGLIGLGFYVRRRRQQKAAVEE